MKNRNAAFSLVEVVIALGIVSFAIVAILGLVPTGLQTSHASQDETRAAQIAQSILSSMASQSQTQFSGVKLQMNDGSTPPVFDLGSSGTASVYVNNDGQLSANSSNAIYAITITTNSSPTGFDTGYANEVKLTVAWPATAAPANQTKRDFVRIISKY